MSGEMEPGRPRQSGQARVEALRRALAVTSCSPIGSTRVAKSRWIRSIRCPRIVVVEQLKDVTGVEVVGTYRLRLAFDDGTVGEVNFAEREWRGVFEPLGNPDYFARVTVDPEGGTIVWPNGVDMAPEPLYAAARQSSALTVATSR